MSSIVEALREAIGNVPEGLKSLWWTAHEVVTIMDLPRWAEDELGKAAPRTIEKCGVNQHMAQTSYGGSRTRFVCFGELPLWTMRSEPERMTNDDARELLGGSAIS